MPVLLCLLKSVGRGVCIARRRLCEAGGPGIRSLGPRSRAEVVGWLAWVRQRWGWRACSMATANGADERIPDPPAWERRWWG